MSIEQAAAGFLFWFGPKPDTRPILDYFSSK